MDVDDLFNVAGNEGFQCWFGPLQALQAEVLPFSPGPPSNNSSPPADNTPPISWHHHPVLDGKFHLPHHILQSSLILFFSGTPCDEEGIYLPCNNAGSFPPPPPQHADNTPDDWTPYQDRVKFEMAEFLYCKAEMSATNIDTLLDLWGATLYQSCGSPPFSNHSDLYDTINSTLLGSVPWQNFFIVYQGMQPQGEGVVVPEWMTSSYEVWFHDPHVLIKNILANPDYNDHIDYAPIQEFGSMGSHQYHNFMSGDWAWEQAVHIYVSVDLLSISLIYIRMK